MREYVFTLLIALAAGALAIVCAYFQRGYWAVGAECIVPLIVSIALLYTKGDQNEQDNNRAE